MHVHLDGQELTVPDADTLAELLGGIAPLMDPSRLVVRLDVDGAAADATDAQALAAWRLRPGAVVQVDTEAPGDFARARRAEIGGHLSRIADMLARAGAGLAGGEVAGANRLVAAASHELRLVLELDQHLAALQHTTATCGAVRAVVERIGTQLTAAEEERRWTDVAALLAGELVPALRAAADLQPSV